MLGRARERLPGADLRLGAPRGSASRRARSTSSCRRSPSTTSTAHAKRDLFTRVAQLTDAFVLGDVVVPERPEDAAIEIDGVYDVPSQRRRAARVATRSRLRRRARQPIRADLAVFRCRKRSTTKSVAKPSTSPARTSHVTSTVCPYLRFAFEELLHDVEDRAGRHREERDGHRLARPCLPEHRAEERRRAADQRRAARGSPRSDACPRRSSGRRCRSPRSRCAARSRRSASPRGSPRRSRPPGRSRGPRRSCGRRCRPRSAARAAGRAVMPSTQPRRSNSSIAAAPGPTSVVARRFDCRFIHSE